MQLPALILFYLTGYASAYYLFRYIIRNKMQERWTRMMRLCCLLASSLSWIGLVMFGIMFIIRWLKPDYDFDKEVKK